MIFIHKDLLHFTVVEVIEFTDCSFGTLDQFKDHSLESRTSNEWILHETLLINIVQFLKTD